jgi:uncharacterized membrane protein YkvA (DUF1232 family)
LGFGSVRLTNADRRVLLESVRTLATDWVGDNAELIVWATGWVASLAPTFGFELNLSRDVFLLCDTLRKPSADAGVARLARGGLAYLYRNNHVDPAPLGPLGLLDDAFVAGYAAHAIRDRTGEAVRYRPPRLGPDEQARAEQVFLDLLDRPGNEDDVLPGLAEIALAQLGHLLESGLFRRLRRNVRFLSHVLADSGHSAEHRRIARAALHYVAAEQDAIPNPLGLLGFLDDYFVAELAVGLIDPGQSPWMNLIDAVVAAWPFLNMVSFGDGQKGNSASEFLMVNAALTCPVLRAPEAKLTHLVLPRTGPFPLLLGFFASLGELLSARRRQGSAVSFKVGQKVLVDGKGGAYTFEGCRTIDGQMMFGVGKVRKERGQTLRSSQWLPIEQLNRLVPADPDRSVRGRLAVADLRAEPLGALDLLFLAAEPVTVPPDMPQVVVVTPVGLARDTAQDVSLFGHRLCDTVPMGNLTASGDVSPWSGQFGSSRPAVLVVPDLDRACEYVEGEGDKVALTIVDASGHNAGRLAALSRLQAIGARVLVTVGQADADGVIDDASDSVVWEWDRPDFESVYVEPGLAAPEGNPVRAYEREVVRAVSASAEVVPVQAPEVEEAVRSVSALKRLAEARGEDVPQELEDALAGSFAVLTRLLRCPFRLSSHPRLAADLATRLDTLFPSQASGLFLSGQELDAIADAERQLRSVFTVLQQRNAKEDALTDLRRTCPELVVVCGDVELLDGAEGLGVRTPASALDEEEGRRDSAHVVAGWFGRGTMTRLLRPPFATPLYLLLYGPEVSWHGAFNRRVRQGSAARRVRTARGRLFPGVGKWPDRPAGDPSGMDGETTTAEGETPDAIQTYLLSERRRRLTSQATPSDNEEAVEARLVTFDGGYAFLTEDYQAKLATHLLADAADGEDAELEIVPARRLQRGDVLLFLRGSSRDVIRQTADKLLPPGEREKSGAWRRVLLKYREQEKCSVEVVWQRLREHGCPLSLAAIENWFTDENMISPLNVDREVGAILALTQDPDLRDGLDACRAAISRVRGAHLRASNLLARKVVERAVAGLKAAGVTGGAVDLGDGIVLARVTEIDDTTIRVKASAANRLVEDKLWPA